jgi:hypothetical protein
MRVSDIQSELTWNIEIEAATDDKFEGKTPINLQNEVSLYLVDANIILRRGEDNWEVRGIDKTNQNRLTKLLERNLPSLSWISGINPKKSSSPTSMTVQINQFPARRIWEEKIEIGIDDRIIEQIRSKHLKKAATAREIIDWLDGQLLLPLQEENAENKRAIIMANPDEEQNRIGKSLRTFGKEIAIDVKRNSEDKLFIDRVVKYSRNNTGYRQQILVEGLLSFCDISIAGQFRGTAKTELDNLVEKAGSYLSLWLEYNQLEKESIVARVREFGFIYYHKQEVLENGDRRFHLKPTDDLTQKIAMLSDSDNYSLSADKAPPEYLLNSDGEELGENDNKNKVFYGQIAGLNQHKLTIDLRPSDPDEEELIPPPFGCLFMSIQGDKARLQRREKAEELIRNAQCPMPQLGLFLENQSVPLARYQKVEALSAKTKKVFGNSGPTARQKEALQIALNTPDIALIQGPPGTGKTKVISALQVRLAEVSDKNSSVSGRTLLTSYQHDAVENAADRSVVFGLPPYKVGKRRGDTEASDNVVRWCKENIDKLRAKLTLFPELPETDILQRVRRMVRGYILAPGNPQQTAQLLRSIFDLTEDKIPGSLSDRLLELSQQLSRNQINKDDDPEERELSLKAVRGLRTNETAFADDGTAKAFKALKRLERLKILEPKQRELLEKAADWDEDKEPPFLSELEHLKTDLLEKLTPSANVVMTAVSNPEIEELLTEIVNILYEGVYQSKAGVDGAIAEYLHDLENDPDGVRQMIRDYTVVLAATCQQSVGREMLSAKDDNIVFENVIVDEAARANPLDLFIPLARAERRIILVGDHRQLPHILEPDVERQLNLSTETTSDALKKSLFERLFLQLQEREKTDGIKRTITLDTQYRMHSILGDFVSRTFYEYNGEPPIRAGRPDGDFIHNLPGYEGVVAAWTNVPLSHGRETKGKSKSRPIEAKYIARELKRLIEFNPDLSFGVITFYSAQVRELWQALYEQELAEYEDGIYRIAAAYRETRNSQGNIIERLRVGTVDAFQGKEFDVVFLSVTRCNDYPTDSEGALRKKYGYLMVENRLCVAMSRQQKLLIAVGDLEMVKPEAAASSIRGLTEFYQLCKGEYGKIFSA